MAFCGKCGQQLPDTARFCGKCGAAMVAELAAVGAAAGPAPSPSAQRFDPPPQAPPYAPAGYAYPPRPSFASQMSPGLWIVMIGAGVSALFTIISWIQTASLLRGVTDGMSGDFPMPTASPMGSLHAMFFMGVVLFAISGWMAYAAAGKSGRARVMRMAVVLTLAGMWPVLTILGLVAAAASGLPLLMGVPGMVVLIVLGGIAQAIGALIDLVQNA